MYEKVKKLNCTAFHKAIDEFDFLTTQWFPEQWLGVTAVDTTELFKQRLTFIKELANKRISNTKLK